MLAITRRLRISIVLVAACAFTLAPAISAARADGIVTPATSIVWPTKITAPMTCVSGCATPTSTTIQPATTVSGDCGTATLNLSNDGNGVARFGEILTSTRGAITSGVRDLSWFNYSTDNGAERVISFTANSTTWINTDSLSTGNGFVAGTFSGTVSTASGSVCIINYPSSSTTVTPVYPG